MDIKDIPYPIFYTTSDPEIKTYSEKRYMYFVKSINSLEKSETNLSNLHIFDDHSVYHQKLQFLLKKSWQYKVKYRSDNLGPTLNTVLAIEYLYQKFDSEYIVFLQDDVIFSKKWLENTIKTYRLIDRDIKNRVGQCTKYANMKRVGIMCAYNRRWPTEDPYVLFEIGHPGGVAWIIKTEFWADYRKHYSVTDTMETMFKKNDLVTHRRRNLIDYKLCTRAHEIGWHCAIVGKSMVQHIGDQSSIGKRDMTQHRSKSFVGEE